MGILPVYQDEQINYLTNKLNGYLTGAYIYNKMSLTEQVPSVITVAVRYPVRPFRLNKLSVECVKSYVEKPADGETLYLIQILDAVKDLKHIPAERKGNCNLQKQLLQTICPTTRFDLPYKN